MELNAYTKTIRDLFSVSKKYIVPRFQREYSWGKDEIDALWDDVTDNIKIEKGKCVNQEYFIGAIVLIGEDKSFELLIVDGQQRLTTITILLSALVQALKGINDGNAQALYSNYLEGKDEDNNPYFKLINETPKPFFQRSIQFYEKENVTPSNKEERVLQDAYNLLIKKLEITDLVSKIDSDKNLVGDEAQRYYKILISLRDQILNYLKVIYITVKDEDDAYTIFETLNARGINLTPVDLIKNEVFKNLKRTHPEIMPRVLGNKLELTFQLEKGKLILTFFSVIFGYPIIAFQ